MRTPDALRGLYRPGLAAPIRVGAATEQLALNIALALSVLGHFVIAMVWRRLGGVLGSRRSRRLDRSVFFNVHIIVRLAKAMFPSAV